MVPRLLYDIWLHDMEDSVTSESDYRESGLIAGLNALYPGLFPSELKACTIDRFVREAIFKYIRLLSEGSREKGLYPIVDIRRDGTYRLDYKNANSR